MRQEFSSKEAFIFSLIFHCLFLVALVLLPVNKDYKKDSRNQHDPEKKLNSIVLINPKQLTQPVPVEKHRTFVDVPDSVSKREPINKKTDLFSDRPSRAGGEGKPGNQSRDRNSNNPGPEGPGKDRGKPKDSTRTNAGEEKREKTPRGEDGTGTMRLPAYAQDSSLAVRNRIPLANRQGRKDGAFDFLGAAKNVGDSIETDQGNDSDSDGFGDGDGSGGSGDGSGGTGLSFDVNFDQFGWYAQIIYRRVSRNWHLTLSSILLRQTGTTVVYFSINRKGAITDLKILESAGAEMLDLAAYNALKEASPLPPLPSAFPYAPLNGRFTFIVSDKE